MSVCGSCNKKIRNSDWITCDICRKNIHVECAGLSKLEVDCVRSNSRKIHFYCDKCDIITTINDLKDEIEGLKSELNELKNCRNKVDDDSHKKLSDEEIITEVEDRNRRANNLILYNCRNTLKSQL